MFKLISKWKKQRTTFKELMQLSDRDLSDLGISRCDIRELSRSI